MIKITRLFDQGGIGLELAISITNASPQRKFTLTAMNIKGEGSDIPVFSGNKLIEPDAHFSIETEHVDFVNLAKSTHIEVRLAPSIVKRIALPHHADKYKKRSGDILDQIAQSAAPYHATRDENAILFGNDKADVPIYPLMLTLVRNEKITRPWVNHNGSEDEKNALRNVLEHLAEKHPELFELKSYGLGDYLRWQPKVREFFQS